MVTAFLNANVKEETYMKQPQGFDDGTGRVCRLLKALYGLPASPLWWFEMATEAMSKIGFEPLCIELCIFRKKTGALLILYVDDMIIAAPTTKEVDQIGADLSEVFELKALGEARQFLGLELKRDRKNKVIFINQEKYINKILDKFAPDIKNPAMTPWPPKKEIPHNWRTEKVIMTSKEWLKRTGSLNYVSVGTRPDITYTIQKLCEANMGSTATQDEIMKHLFRYPAGTKSLSIRLGGKYTLNALNPRVFADASFADDLAERFSTAGHVVFIGDRPVHCRVHEPDSRGNVRYLDQEDVERTRSRGSNPHYHVY